MPNGLTAVQPGDVRPGDLLLSKGTSDVSQLISELQGGLYSHAAYWDGSKVVHATTGGVVTGPLESLSDPQHYAYADVYRLEPRELFPFGRLEFGHRRFPETVVTEEAHRLVGGPYDFASTFLLAWLLWESDEHLSMRAISVAFGFAVSEGIRAMRGRVRTALDGIQRPGSGKEAMTCTELITTSFWRASEKADGRRRAMYLLEFVIDRPRSVPWRRQPLAALAPEHPDEFRLLLEDCRRLVGGRVVEEEADAGLRDLFRAPAVERTVAAGSPDLPLQLVSPLDMQRSPSLLRQGRLYPA